MFQPASVKLCCSTNDSKSYGLNNKSLLLAHIYVSHSLALLDVLFISDASLKKWPYMEHACGKGKREMRLKQ